MIGDLPRDLLNPCKRLTITAKAIPWQTNQLDWTSPARREDTLREGFTLRRGGDILGGAECLSEVALGTPPKTIIASHVIGPR